MAEAGNSVELLTPVGIAKKFIQIGVDKANLPFRKMFTLAILAGAFVALGGMFFLITTTDMNMGYGPSQVLGGLVFNLGLLLCAVAGAELFTGNALMVIAFAQRKITLGKLLRNWTVVYTGNAVGALLIASLAFVAEHYTGGGNQVGVRLLAVAASKMSYPMLTAFVKAIFCNILVVLAVWIYTAGKTIIDKVAAMILPITAFVAGGYEHSIANLFFVPYALLVKNFAPAVAAMPGVPVDKIQYLQLDVFLLKLIPVTLGNIVGGVVIGLAYWFVYLRDDLKAQRAIEAERVA